MPVAKWIEGRINQHVILMHIYFCLPAPLSNIFALR